MKTKSLIVLLLTSLSVSVMASDAASLVRASLRESVDSFSLDIQKQVLLSADPSSKEYRRAKNLIKMYLEQARDRAELREILKNKKEFEAEKKEIKERFSLSDSEWAELVKLYGKVQSANDTLSSFGDESIGAVPINYLDASPSEKRSFYSFSCKWRAVEEIKAKRILTLQKKASELRIELIEYRNGVYSCTISYDEGLYYHPDLHRMYKISDGLQFYKARRNSYIQSMLERSRQIDAFRKNESAVPSSTQYVTVPGLVLRKLAEKTKV